MIWAMGPETWKLGEAADRLVVALDFPSAGLALDLVDRLDGSCRWVKVGLELYCGAGNTLVEALGKRGLKVFLDLKLHDIPNTVAGAVRSISGLGASLLTVHSLGGGAMMRAAAEAVVASSGAPRLLAVTMLTSMDGQQMRQVGLMEQPTDQVLRLARLAEECGIDGLVCSAEETRLVRDELGPGSLLVVPGIRPTGSTVGDQRRVATPAEAMRRGASMLVVGRPITEAPDPGAAMRSLLAEKRSAGDSGVGKPSPALA